MIRRHRPLLLALALAATLANAGPVAANQVDLPDQAGWDAARRMAVTPDGVHLTYLELGQEPGMEKGAPIILIHGYTDNSRSWSLLAPTLRQEMPDRRIIAVDLRGHGSSDAPGCCYGPDSLASDVAGLMQALQISQADVVGHSLGSMTAAYLAATRPASIRRLVLLSSATRLPAASRDWLWQKVPDLAQPIDPDGAFMKEWFANPTPVAEDFLKRERADAAAVPLHVWNGVLQTLSAWDWAPLAPRIQARTMIAWGDQDTLFDAKAQTVLQAALPAPQYVQFDGLGHNFFWEQPEKVGKTISGFLTEAPSP